MVYSKAMPKTKGVLPSRKVHYMKISKHADLAIDTLVELIKTSKNDNVKMGAAKTIINKVVPDLKSTEMKGSISPIQVQVLAGYVNKALGGVVEGEVVAPSKLLGEAKEKSKEVTSKGKDSSKTKS